jgi:aspartate kinase
MWRSIRPDLNQGFEKFAQHLRQNGLSWPQLLRLGVHRRKNPHHDDVGFRSRSTPCCARWQEARTLRKQRETLSFGEPHMLRRCFFRSAVQGDQILQHHGIVADKYVLSPHSVNLFVPVESREAAVKALHSLI